MQEIETPEMEYDWTLNRDLAYTTRDEIGFLRTLAVRKPVWFHLYANVVLNDLRRWDKTVDVLAVKDVCAGLLENIRDREADL